MKPEAIYAAVIQERSLQEEQHGPYTCASRELSPFAKSVIAGEELGEVAAEVQALNRWLADIVRTKGEVDRAVFESHRANLQKELVQLVACGWAWLESL